MRMYTYAHTYVCIPTSFITLSSIKMKINWMGGILTHVHNGMLLFYVRMYVHIYYVRDKSTSKIGVYPTVQWIYVYAMFLKDNNNNAPHIQEQWIPLPTSSGKPASLEYGPTHYQSPPWTSACQMWFVQILACVSVPPSAYNTLAVLVVSPQMSLITVSVVSSVKEASCCHMVNNIIYSLASANTQ